MWGEILPQKKNQDFFSRRFQCLKYVFGLKMPRTLKIKMCHLKNI